MLLCAFVFRLFLSFFGTLPLDQNTFIAWSNSLAEGGMGNFYSGWSDYLPGYMYVLWFLGKVSYFPISETVLFKLPAIIADLATGFLIYKIVFENLKREKAALVFSALYLFNPAIFANSTLWGQVDALTILFSLLALYFANSKFVLSAIFLSIGVCVKPQAILVAPILFFVMMRDSWKTKKIVLYGAISVVALILIFLPFGPRENLFSFILERFSKTLGQYKYTSINAFSFWGIFGFWKEDFVFTQMLGFLITLLVPLLLSRKLWSKKGGGYILLSIIFSFGFFFTTRMHERHLLPSFAPLLISASILPSVIFPYIFLSVLYVVNLYYSYIWITKDFLEIFPKSLINILIFGGLFSISWIFVDAWRYNTNKVRFFEIFKNSKNTERHPKIVDSSFSQKNWKLILIAIICFAATLRVFALSLPKTEYFDEVYHAFTARTMLQGDEKAWEWWNDPPEGFAYEWTHPPLAKEGMVLGMLVFGENAFGWRIPGAILGTLVVFLVFLIARKLFESLDIALLSAAVFSLEGLPLVMSRIGMNDSYLLFFVLSSLFLFLKDRYLFSAFALGLAAASKWSTLWFLPVLFVTHFVMKKKITPKYIFYFIVPPLIYFASYIPFFTSGHSLDQFVELQKQMWWYHTQLKAEHAYSSAWYSWPLMIRPIWLYVGNEAGMIQKIYAMGNPFLFWTGFVSILACAYWAIKERYKKLGLVVFSYMVFFVSWAASPRIMFLYHFLPSIPFMAIATGYFLKKKQTLIIPVILLSFVTLLYFYPHMTGISVSEVLDESYYWFPSWR